MHVNVRENNVTGVKWKHSSMMAEIVLPRTAEAAENSTVAKMVSDPNHDPINRNKSADENSATRMVKNWID